MLDKTIDSALLNLRKKLIRGDGEGLEHVEALLRLRRIDPPRVLPTKRNDAAKCGHMTMMIRDVLRDGPKPMQEIASYIVARRPEISNDVAYKRTTQALANMKFRGQVQNDGRYGGLWTIAEHQQGVRKI